MPAKPLTTRLSTKGQVILPKSIRDSLNWRPGAELVVENRPDGVLLRRAVKASPPTKIEDVFGSLKYDGPVLSIEDMNEAVLEEAAHRARD